MWQHRSHIRVVENEFIQERIPVVGFPISVL